MMPKIPEVRMDDDVIDEIVGHDTYVHLERMDTGHIWLKVGEASFTLYTKRFSPEIEIIQIEGAPNE